ncbi:LysR family transcriptional regulator [Shimwellia blattae]|uniref:LysR family transcriptional regulator n=1 Tax=Shimwellia blattae TaxID=563 RepID=UPI000F6D2C93|nr:LysR family transcriptional regulator [Shimwellia blattae]VDY64739.1 D-malate degradation protein R [Shimwellia blattae]
MDFNQIAVFIKVVQAGSFSAAARQLSLPVSTVSHRVAMLEKRLGITLLQRTTRRLHLTEAGQIYFQHASAGLGQLLDAEAAIKVVAAEPCGLLRVSVLPDLGEQLLASILLEIRDRWPRLQVELLLTHRRMDLVSEGVDAAIRAGELEDSSLVARKVGTARWAVFTSPGYLATTPAPETPEQLCQHPCLQFTPMGKTAWAFSRGRSMSRCRWASKSW